MTTTPTPVHNDTDIIHDVLVKIIGEDADDAVLEQDMFRTSLVAILDNTTVRVSIQYGSDVTLSMIPADKSELSVSATVEDHAVLVRVGVFALEVLEQDHDNHDRD